MTDDLDPRRPYPVLAAGEAILWRGKPKRGAFIATKSLTMLPIAVVWLCLDLNILIPALTEGEMMLFLIPFFALHLMPVWIWLGSMISAGRRWKNTAYYVTNRRVILQGGFFAVNETSLFYKDLRNVRVRIGLLDKLFRTGDIVLDGGGSLNRRDQTNLSAMEDLEQPHEVYSRIQKIILDMQTDMEYPNALRPTENPGYRTDYRP
ncbi:MAG: PH domain-containing protein [Firmicutes bacterium]|nr:PH domain-containing protein [Bacillota bacterium]